GVKAVTSAFPIPLDGSLINSRWGKEEAAADPSKFQQADAHIVLPGYFETMRSKLIAGRVFTEADNRPDFNGVVIDQLLAKKAFPGDRPSESGCSCALAHKRPNGSRSLAWWSTSGTSRSRPKGARRSSTPTASSATAPPATGCCASIAAH